MNYPKWHYKLPGRKGDSESDFQQWITFQCLTAQFDASLCRSSPIVSNGTYFQGNVHSTFHFPPPPPIPSRYSMYYGWPKKKKRKSHHHQMTSNWRSSLAIIITIIITVFNEVLFFHQNVRTDIYIVKERSKCLFIPKGLTRSWSYCSESAHRVTCVIVKFKEFYRESQI